MEPCAVPVLCGTSPLGGLWICYLFLMLWRSWKCRGSSFPGSHRMHLRQWTELLLDLSCRILISIQSLAFVCLTLRLVHLCVPYITTSLFVHLKDFIPQTFYLAFETFSVQERVGILDLQPIGNEGLYLEKIVSPLETEMICSIRQVHFDYRVFVLRRIM